jgi:hypothetical protein
VLLARYIVLLAKLLHGGQILGKRLGLAPDLPRNWQE